MRAFLSLLSVLAPRRACGYDWDRFRAISSRVVASSLCIVGCGGGSASGSTTTSALPVPACPDEAGLCLVLARNDCSADPCTSERPGGLPAIEIVPLDRGVEATDRRTVVEGRGDGVYFAAVAPGAYRVRRPDERQRGFSVTLDADRLVLDTRSGGGSAVLKGVVDIEVGGGADGNDTVSSGGPGRHLVVSVTPFVDDTQLDRRHVRFAITDDTGRFEMRLPPGRYYVSDLNEANETGVHTFGSNLTPVRGREVTLPAADGPGDDAVELRLVASEFAP